jgi:hypothetical protein
MMAGSRATDATIAHARNLLAPAGPRQQRTTTQTQSALRSLSAGGSRRGQEKAIVVSR